MENPGNLLQNIGCQPVEFSDDLIQDLIETLDSDYNPASSNFDMYHPCNYPCDFTCPQDDNPYMGQWAKIEELSRSESDAFNRINSLWRDMTENSVLNMSFFSFRKNFAELIENTSWRRINVSDYSLEATNMAKGCIAQFIERINQLLQEFNGTNFLNAASQQDFRYHLEHWHRLLLNPKYTLVIVELMQKVLHEEYQIIMQSVKPETAMPVSQVGVNNCQTAMDQKMDDNQSRISQISKDIQELIEVKEYTDSLINEFSQQVEDLQLRTDEKLHVIEHVNMSQLTPQLQAKWHDLRKRRDTVIRGKANMIKNFHMLHLPRFVDMLYRVLDVELKHCQRNQAYANNGKKILSLCEINQLESWCKNIAKLLNGNIQQMAKLYRLDIQLGVISSSSTSEQMANYEVLYLSQRYANMLQDLVRRSLVVDKHPPQVLMKDKRFCCSLRHLVGDGLDIHQVPFEVEGWLVNAEEAAKVLKEGSSCIVTETGKISNSVARSDYSDLLRQLTVNMRNMCLKMGQRGAAKNAAEMVAELKFCMLFRAKISVRIPAVTLNSAPVTVLVVAQTMSLPIVVISHGKQEADAQATIFWDNAFSEVNRVPFEVPESVPWRWILDALEARWVKECEDGVKRIGLNAMAKEYLTKKMFENNVDDSKLMSWKKFNHEKLFSCGKKNQRKELFTFWTWFFKAMDLVSSLQVKKYWNAGLVHGFVSKTDCTSMLKANGKPGAFLFRFSETKLGSLSISCSPAVKGRLHICHLQPDQAKDFNVRSLPDMVGDLNYLCYLYPDRPKDEAFGPYYSAATDDSPPDDYVRKDFRAHTEDPEDLMENRNTWQPPFPNVYPGDADVMDQVMEDSSEDRK